MNINMRKAIKFIDYIFILLFIPVIYPVSSKAQNYLSPSVNIQFKNDSSLITRNAKSDTILSTLISWERQCYFSGDGDFTLSSNFFLDDISKRYLLKIRLECQVKHLMINGKAIGNNLEYQYYDSADRCAEFILSDSILKKGINTIEADCSEMFYTGGTTHKIFSLTPLGNNKKEKIGIYLNSHDHVYSNKNCIAKISTSSLDNGYFKLHLEDIYHKVYLDSIINIKKGNYSYNIPIGKYCKSSGIYQIKTDMKGVGYVGDVQWLIVNPNEIIQSYSPDDSYKKYWEKAIKELSSIKPNFKMQKNDSLSLISKRDVYITEMQSLGDITIRGYLFVPRNNDIHPAILHLPGYGWGFENIDNFLNMDSNRIDYALCVRGHGISRDKFNPGFGIPGIWGYKLYDEDSLSYRGIYLDCVRAVDLLRAHKNVDKNRIGVKGGSQGGGLALATAGLCGDKIAACAYFDPFPCNMRSQIKTRKICETELKNFLKYYGNPISYEEAMNKQDYIDCLYMAGKIKCPVLFIASLFDDDCPINGGFSAYNRIQSPKSYIVFPNDGHIEGFNHDEIIMNWLNEKLN